MLLALMLALLVTDPAVTGVVKDSTGGVIPGATVVLKSSSGEQQTVTGPTGQFTFDTVPSGELTITVRAGGLKEDTRKLTDMKDIEIVLVAGTHSENVTVTPARTDLVTGGLPTSVSVVDRAQIDSSPSVVADDVLRQVPSFSLFRRTSSLSSHPTAQGVSLRGIGPSGVSRTLVLLDGVPFNDPFGGWVYWTRVPMVGVNRIEIVEDTNSSIYGNYAMGGVINIVSGPASRRTAEIKTQYGNNGTPKIEYFGSDRIGKLGVAISGNAFNTDGFPNVAENEHGNGGPTTGFAGGNIDVNATVKFNAFSGKADYPITDHVSVFGRAGYFSEDRENAKIGEVNDTHWNFFNAGTRIQLPDGGDLQVRVFGDWQKFHSTFLAVTNATCPVASLSADGCAVATRNFVRLTLDQNVPTDSFGTMAQWGRPFGRFNLISAGADWRWVDGDSNEDSYNATSTQPPGSAANPALTNPSPWEDFLPVTLGSVLALQRVSGGTQQISGGFVQDVMTPTDRLTVTLSARVDHWRNYDGHNLETAVIPGTAVNNKPDLIERSDTVVSPRVGGLYKVSDQVTAWGAWGSGFRAPTLNELYRQFRVGTALTLANDNLGPERLRSGELGVTLVPARDLSLRTTWFDNRVENPVANVTICAGTLNLQTGVCTPSANASTLQRQNLGRTRIYGLQTQGDYRFDKNWHASAGYIYNVAKVTDGGATNAALANSCPGPQLLDPTKTSESCYLAQVPIHRGSFQIGYSNPKYVDVTFGMQFFGRQFDDDQNTRVVPSGTLQNADYDVPSGCSGITGCEPGLPGYSTADLFLSRAIGRNFDVFFGLENMFDQTYFVGTQPTTIGSPRLITGGFRVRWTGR